MNTLTAKKKFFNQLHQSLVEKYPNLYDSSLVEALRRYSITYKKTPQQIIVFLDEKNAFTWTEAKKKQHVANTMRETIANMEKKERLTKEIVSCIDIINRRNMLINFLKTCTKEQWEEITQKTEYDK